MSNLLNLLQSHGIEPRRSSVAHGGEYCSACPACGDGGKGKGSDRFHIWPDKPTGGLCNGRFWCRQCDISGDTIEFVMRFDNMTFPQACSSLGIRLAAGDCSHYSRPVTPCPPAAQQYVPRTYPDPAAEWSLRAAAFLEDCQERLLARPDALAWLAGRGISLEAAVAYGLGYNESSRGKDRYRPRSLWALPSKKNDKGKDKKLWLPRGWVVPMFSDDDRRVLQLRIRRLDADVASFASDIRYLMVDGSSSATMVLHPGAEAHAVVESGLDAILIAAALGGQVGAVTTWNCSARPDAGATDILNRSQCVLNCFDFDAAGEKEQAWWQENFRRYKRWPVPVGKDPGEAHENGVSIRQWILDGLPMGMCAKIGGGTVAAAKNGRKQEDVLAAGEPDTTYRQFTDSVVSQIAESLDVPVTLLTADMPVEFERIPGLKWCPLCWGDRFLAGDEGGYFCTECQPMTIPGRIVRATVARAEHVVD